MDNSSSNLEAENAGDSVCNPLDAGPSQQPPPKKTKKYGSVSVMSPKVVTVLDKCKVTDRDAVHLVSAVVEALGFDPASIIASRSSIRRARQKLRVEKAEKIQLYFKDMNLDAAIIHFDGKLFPDDKGSGKHERLAIILTSGEVEKLLSVPVLPDSRKRGRQRLFTVN